MDPSLIFLQRIIRSCHARYAKLACALPSVWANPWAPVRYSPAAIRYRFQEAIASGVAAGIWLVGFGVFSRRGVGGLLRRPQPRADS
jgi:hypothetical protein